VRSPAKTLGTAALVAAVVAALWLLWPSSLGGRTTYVVTHGVSMEPGFHSGDLAILHSVSSYGVGDVAAYHSDTLHTVVMHRIHGLDPSGGFVFKGDNNSWLDPDHPTRAKLLGRLWLRVPGGGRFLTLAHSPWALGIMGALVIGIGSTKAQRGRKRRSRRAQARPVIPAERLATARTAAALLAGVAVASSAAAGYLWSLPAATSGTRTVTLTHAPTVSYGAVAQPGITYPDGRVHPGQPVYLRLVHQLTLGVNDKLTSTSALGPVSTTVTLQVVLATPAGWSTTLASLPATALGAGPVTVTVDLPTAVKKLAAVSAETGVPQQGGTLTVVAHLDSATSLAGQPVRSVADTSYAFNLDASALRPAAATTNAPASTTTSALSTKVTVPTTGPTTVTVRGHRVSLNPLRTELSLLALAAWLMTFGLLPLLRTSKDETARAIRVLAGRLVQVAALDPGDRVVAVATAADLLRIADRYERLVLHLPGDHTSVFAVHDDGVSYVLTVGQPDTARRHLWAA
jgi:signal peptidase I